MRRSSATPPRGFPALPLSLRPRRARDGRFSASLLAAAAIAVSLALPCAALATDEALALVPPDAASVGLVRLDELRSSPLASRIFEDMDHVASDGDGARFFEETGLRPKQDVDVVVVAAVPRAGGRSCDGVVFFEGRFDPARLSAALVLRGAERRSGPDGEYLLLEPEKEERARGAVAFASRRLVIAGDEGSVLRALGHRRAGGSGFLGAEGLGRQLHRISGDASAWAIVDATRYPLGRRGGEPGEAGGKPTQALVGAMKSVTLFAFEASSRGEELDLAAIGVAPEEEDRELLEDALRGVLAMWRLAVQEKSPDLVPVLRRFKVTTDGDAVTIRGTLPGPIVRTLLDHPRGRQHGSR